MMADLYEMWRGAYKIRVEVDGWTPYVVEAARPGGRTPPFPLALEPERAAFAAHRAGRRTSAEFYPGGVDLRIISSSRSANNAPKPWGRI